jgi:hypothetical protein
MWEKIVRIKFVVTDGGLHILIFLGLPQLQIVPHLNDIFKIIKPIQVTWNKDLSGKILQIASSYSNRS